MSSTSTKILVVFLFVMVFAQYEEGSGVGTADGNSRVWPVGDSAGWIFGVTEWSKNKPFKAGDVLLFRYKPEEHNVVQVNVKQHSRCEVPSNATVWRSGNDRITLSRGESFFISGIPGDCEEGMSIAVTAR